MKKKVIQALYVCLALGGMGSYSLAQAETASTVESNASAAVEVDRVNINTATAQQLAEQLEGIGQRRAEAIVSYREEHGPFTEVEALQEVPGIGAALLERNLPRLTL